MTKRVYVNTSVLIALLYRDDPNHEYAIRFIEYCRNHRIEVVTSSILLEEVKDTRSEHRVKELITQYGISVIDVNVNRYLRESRNIINSHRFSASRLFDIAYVLVARDYECCAVASFDRKMLSFARTLGLEPINPKYTKYDKSLEAR